MLGRTLMTLGGTDSPGDGECDLGERGGDRPRYVSAWRSCLFAGARDVGGCVV